VQLQYVNLSSDSFWIGSYPTYRVVKNDISRLLFQSNTKQPYKHSGAAAGAGATLCTSRCSQQRLSIDHTTSSTLRFDKSRCNCAAPVSPVAVMPRKSGPVPLCTSSGLPQIPQFRSQLPQLFAPVVPVPPQFLLPSCQFNIPSKTN